MKKKRVFFKVILKAFIVLYFVTAIVWTVRLWTLLFSSMWCKEWTDYFDTVEVTERDYEYRLKMDYHMETLFEVYMIKDYEFTSEEKLTREELEAEFQPIVDKANEHFDGSPVKLYVGQSLPDNIDCMTAPWKIVLTIFRVPFEYDDEEVLGYHWHVLIYKRARAPFLM